MDGPEINCEKCKSPFGLFDTELTEAAVLTCPVCGTQFSITAVLRSNVKKADSETQQDVPSLPGPPSSPEIPPPPPGPPTSASPSAPVAPESFDLLAKNLMDGEDLEKALDKFLGEEEMEKETWKGSLASFNTKIQALSRDIGYDGDLGDLVSDLRDGEALEIKGENVEIDLEKAKRVLVKHVVNKSDDLPPHLKLGGDDEDLLRPEDELSLIGAGFKPSSVSVTKAVETYFS